MLTADLLDYGRRSGAIVPRLLDPAAPAAREAAAALLALAEGQLGQPRAALLEALRAVEFPALAPKAALGLAHLVLERCTFEVAAAVEPAALRAAVFDAAAAAWRAGPAPGGAGADPAVEPGTPAWRAAVLAAAAGPLGLDAAAADAALYADLEDNQRLLAVEPLRAEELPWRYNVALVQGLLLRAERMTLTAPWPAPQRLRQLMRWLKFYRLLFRQESGAEALRLVLDGPLSVLESATRYGLELAQFFPALLLWEQPWRLEAELRLGKARRPARLRLEPHPWLRSHYPDHGQWIAAEVERFVAAFNAGAGPWRAQPAEALLMLPGNRCLVPDVELRREGAPPVYLEQLATPDAAQVSARLEQLAAAQRADYLLACRATPSVRALGEPPALVAYRRSLLPSLVRAALERVSPG
jgi:uncharacterized protein